MEKRVNSVVVAQESKATLAELMLLAAIRMKRKPVATVIGVGLTLVAAVSISWLSRQSGAGGLAMMVVMSMAIGVGLYLGFSALMVMDADFLNHLPALGRSGTVIAGGAGVILGAPLAWLAAQLNGVPGLTLLFDSNGAAAAAWLALSVALFAAVVPVMLVAWPISARFGRSLFDNVLFCWKDIEDRHYSWQTMAVVMTATGGVLAMVPVVRLLVPVFIAHLSATFLEQMLEAKK